MSKTVGLILSLEDKCSPQLKKIAERMGITEKEAKKVHTQVTKLAKAMKEDLSKVAKSCAIGFSALAGATVVTLNKTREYADRIDDMSKKIGISKKSFQEWDYIIKQNGAEIDVVQRGMKTLVTQSLNVTKGNKEAISSFKKLGVNVKDSNGHLKNQEVLFGEVIEKLQKMPNGLEKSAMATKLLGKAGIELQPLLAENAKTISDLKKEMNDLGLILDDKTIDSANTFSDNIETINRSLGAVMMSLGNELIPTLNDTCKIIIANMPQIRATVTPVLMGVANVIKFVITHIDTLTAVTVGLVSAFGTFKILSTINNMWLAYTAIVKNVTLAQQMLNIVMNMNPIMRIVTIISGAIGFIVMLEMKTKILTNTFKKLGEVVGKVWDKLHQAQPTSYTLPNQATPPQTQTPTPKVNKYASGTMYAHGGQAVINEKGAELVELPEGSKVMTANATKQLINGGNYTINLNIAGNVIGNNEFIQQVSNALGRQLKTAMAC